MTNINNEIKLKKLIRQLAKIGAALLYFFPVIACSLEIYDFHKPYLKFRNLESSFKLSNKNITDISEDELGRIWIGTSDGLDIVDGEKIQSYSGRETVFSNNRINKVFMDQYNQIWLGTNKGLYKYQRDADDFSKIDNVELEGKQISRLYQQDNDTILIGTKRSGAFAYEYKTKKVRKLEFQTESALGNRFYIYAFYQLLDGTLLVGTRYGMFLYDNDRKLFKKFLPDIDIGPVTKIIQTRQNEILLGSTNGLYKLDLKAKNFVGYLSEYFSGENITDFEVLDNNSLLISTRASGIYLYDLNTSKVYRYQNNVADANSLLDNQVGNIYKAKDGTIWLSTSNGVNFFKFSHLELSLKRSFNPNNKCLSGNTVYSNHLTSRSELWVAAFGSGLHRINIETGLCETITNTSDLDTSNIFQKVVDINEDLQNNLWFATFDKGLIKLDKKNNKLYHFTSDSDATEYKIASNLTNVVTNDAHGNVLIGTYNKGISKVNITDGTISNLVPERPEDITEEPRINDILVDMQDNVWVASEQYGLLLLVDNKYIRIDLGEPNIASPDLNILSLDLDNKGNLWLGTLGLGAIRYSTETNDVTVIDTSNFLNNNIVSKVITDKNDNVWIFTDVGLTKINESLNVSETYLESDGLQSDTLTTTGIYIKDRDKIITGGVNGYNFFEASKLSLSRVINTPIINQFDLFYKKVRLSKDDYFTPLRFPAPYMEKIELNHDQNVFSFSYSALDYFNDERFGFAFRLKGYEDWNYVDSTKTFTNYTNIEPGEYTFQVKSTFLNQESSVRSVIITINPPWWKTIPAYITYVTLLIVSVYQIVIYRTNALKKRTVELKKQVKLRTKELHNEKKTVEQLLSRKNEEFANVSHEFRTPLTLILGPVQQLEKQPDQKTVSSKVEVIKRNAYRLLRMVDQLLHMETFRVKSITQKSVQDFHTIIKLISESFYDLAEAQNIHLDIKKIDKVFFEFTPDALEKIVLNLLSNALKYTHPGGNISISATRKNDNFIIRVKDTGIGIPEEKLDTVFDRFQRVLDENSEKVTGAGIGLALVKELVESHQGNIELQSKVGLGTEVIVNLPIIGEADSLEDDYQSNEEIIALELMSFAAQSSEQASHPKNELTQDRHDSNILVIEDNDDMRNYIVENLQDHFNVITAPDGEAGFKLAEEQIPDIIISDVMMPKMDGYQVTKSLRSSQNTSHIPIVLLTARGDRESRMKGWYEKADEYLTKPFDVEELLIRVQNLLDIRELVQKKFSESLFLDDTPIIESIHTVEEQGSKENKVENEFLEKLNSKLEKHYQDPNTKIDIIASDMAMSQRQLLRKLKGLLDMTPVEYLRRFRLDKAKCLLLDGGSVTNAALDVGFASVSHFGKCFKAQYGCSPSEFVDNKGQS